MKVYDNYEISPCTRTEQPDSPGQYYFEVCEPDQADVWTLYGHIPGEGVEAIGDFPTREAAEQVYVRITGSPFTGSYGADPCLRVRHAAPRMLEALKRLLEHALALSRRHGAIGTGPVFDAARAAVAAAEGPPDPSIDTPEAPPIVIEVRGGVVQEVRNVPSGVAYQIVDHDDRDDQDTPETQVSPALPPDPEGMNAARADWAARAVRAFQKATGTDEEDVLSDLLANLMHWADRNNYDFEAALFRARDHYHAETLRVGG